MRHTRSRHRLLLASTLVLLLSLACSPEANRTRGGGPGADIGNNVAPVEMHGNRTRNNPDFQVQGKVKAPRETWGVPGWWSSGGGQAERDR